MATAILKSRTEDGKHAVGSINSIQVKTLANGARITGAEVDNWTLVELAGFNEDGERLCKAVTAADKMAYLVATPEQRFLGEDIAHFFNDVDEFARLVLFEAGYTRFEASNYSLGSGVTEVECGQVAHFDPATKKFIILASDTEDTDYVAAKYKFEVVADLNDTAGNFLQPTVRFMCIEA